ncbi:hypothetical protein ACFQZ4_25425 [Catellatospora coxensis]
MNGTDAAPAKEPTAVKEPVAPRHAAPEPEPVEEDAFARFSPDTEEETPTRVRRTLRGTRFVLLHEWALAAYASLALAVAMTWPTLRYPAYTIPQDTGDPTLQAWQMAWSGHVLKTDWSQLWHSNSFYPEKYSFAFSDTLLGYAPAGLFGTGLEAALVRYNVMYVLLHALAFFGAYVLLRQLGSGKTGAAVAGAAFAYAPWRLAQAGHMHVMSVGGIALALAMLARGHGFSLRHGYRPELRKPGWALAGWLVAAWQISLGFGIGLPFAYVLAGIVLVSAITYFVRSRWVWSEPKPFGWKLFTADAVGGLVFAAVGGLIALAYFKVVELHPYAERSDWEVDFYSPPILGFFTSPAQSMPWGRRTPERGRCWAARRGDQPAARFRAVRPRLRRPGHVGLDAAQADAAVQRRRAVGDPGHGHEVLRRPSRLHDPVRHPAGLERHPHPRPARHLDDAAAGDPGRRGGDRVRRAGQDGVGGPGAVPAAPAAAAGHVPAAAAGGGRGPERHRAPGGAAAAAVHGHGAGPDAGAAQRPADGHEGDGLVDGPVGADRQRQQRLHPDHAQ